ncbi:MAG: hypothetical protein EZS28_032525, partial [Streblomastix strix]
MTSVASSEQKQIQTQALGTSQQQDLSAGVFKTKGDSEEVSIGRMALVGIKIMGISGRRISEVVGTMVLLRSVVSSQHVFRLLECLQCKCESWIAGLVSWELRVSFTGAVSECGPVHSGKKEGAEFQYILAAAWSDAEIRSVWSECDSAYGTRCHITCNWY